MTDLYDPVAAAVEGFGKGPADGRRSRMAWIVALVLGLLVLRWADPLPLELMRLKAFDLAATFCPASGESGQTVAVDIDDASLQAVGQWPWPRGIMARLVERLGGMGVRTVVFAVVFAVVAAPVGLLARIARRCVRNPGIPAGYRPDLRQFPAPCSRRPGADALRDAGARRALAERAGWVRRA